MLVEIGVFSNYVKNRDSFSESSFRRFARYLDKTADDCVSVDSVEVSLIGFLLSLKADEAAVLAKSLAQQWVFLAQATEADLLAQEATVKEDLRKQEQEIKQASSKMLETM